MRKCYFSSFKHYLEKLFLGKLMTEFIREVCPRFITLYNLNINFPQLRLGHRPQISCFCKFNNKCCFIAFKFCSNKLGSYLILCKKFKS